MTLLFPIICICALSLSLARGFGGVVATCCLCDDVLGLVIISALSLSLARRFGGVVATGCLCDAVLGLVNIAAAMKTYGSPPGRVLAPVVGAFGEMSSDIHALVDVIAAAKTADHLQFFKGSAKEFSGMFRQQVIRDYQLLEHRMHSHNSPIPWAGLVLFAAFCFMYTGE